jgi:flagellar M-ring protein FliF
MRGTGKVVVRASIAMDFDKVEKHLETYGEPVLTSEQIKEESSQGTSQITGSNPADANMGGPSYGTIGPSGDNEYQLTERTRNYEVSKTVETKIIAPGKITNISLSVLIDGNLTPEEENKIKAAVTMAAGADLNRGDQVSVVGMPFNNEELSKMEDALAQRESFQRRMEYLKLILIPLSIILVLGFVFFVVRRIKLFETHYSTSKAREIAATNSEEEVELTLSPEALEKKAMQTQIDKLVKKNPEEVAKVIKTWLVEE